MNKYLLSLKDIPVEINFERCYQPWQNCSIARNIVFMITNRLLQENLIKGYLCVKLDLFF